MIKAHQINYLHKDFHILDGVDVSLNYGEFLAIVGPNGAGKSSLLSILANEVKQGKQNILFKDKSIYEWEVRELSVHKAKFSQHNSNEIPLQVKDVVMMGRYPYFDSQPRKEDFEAMNKLMYETDVYHLKERDYNTLSGGEKQRVVIAGALAQLENRGEVRPRFSEILLLDEPTASLDLAYQLEIRSILAELNQRRGLTIVVSTHDLSLAASLCRELVLLDQGHVLAAGPTAIVGNAWYGQGGRTPPRELGRPMSLI